MHAGCFARYLTAAARCRKADRETQPISAPLLVELQAYVPPHRRQVTEAVHGMGSQNARRIIMNCKTGRRRLCHSHPTNHLKIMWLSAS